MRAGLFRVSQGFLVALVLLGFLGMVSVIMPPAALATGGINQEINFQGRLLNSQGATVADGYYNIEFRIYQDGDGQAAGDTGGSPAGTLDWHEDYLNYNSQGVEVINGFLSVELGSITPFGSSVNWNDPTLWLSMNVAGVATNCSTFTACSPDGEMLPMQPLTTSVYALNSNELGGLAASSFGQLAANQTWTGANLIQTTSANGFEVQNSSGTNTLFNVDTSGNNVTIDNSGAAGTIQIGDTTGAVAQTISIGNNTTASSTTTLTLGSTIGSSTSYLQAGTGGLQLATGNASGATGAITIESGNSSTGSSGNIVIDTGTNAGNSSGPSVTIGASNAQVVTLGNSSQQGTTSLLGGTGGIKIGTGTTAASSIQIGSTTTSGSQTINLGNNATSSATTTVNIGASNDATITIEGVGTEETLGSNSTVIESLTNSATGFQVENNGAVGFVTADASSNQLLLGKASSLTGKLAFATAGGGTLTINPTSSASNFTITFPGETGTVCTTASTGVCNTTGGLSNVAYLPQSQTFTGTNTFAPTTNISSAIVKQTSSASSTADVFDVQGTNGTSNFIQVTSTAANQGAVSVASYGSGNGVTIQSASGTVSLGSSSTLSSTGSLAVQAAGTNTLTLNTTGAGTVNLGTTNSTTIGIGNATAATAVTIQGGTGTSAVVLQAGAGGTISIGSTGSTASATTVNIATSTGAAQNVSLGSTNSGSAVTLSAGNIVNYVNPSTNVNSEIFRNSASVATAFEFQNSIGDNIFSVDTSNNQIILGLSNGINGQVQFDNATNANTVSLISGAISGTYSLTLPVTAPTATQCLQSGASTPSQLVFASCDPNGAAILNQETSQAANFYVTAEYSGSVAGTLQAYNGSSGDILDIRNGSGILVDDFDSAGNLNILGSAAFTKSTYASNQVVISDGVTGTPPAYPNSYTPAFTVQTSEISGSRPLFFGYNNGGSWAADLTTGACGAFTQMCLDLGNNSSIDTALENVGTTLEIAGGSDGNFTNVQFENTGDVGIGKSGSYPLDVNGVINTNSTYDINGTALASSNLSDSSNLAKLNATQTFTAANTFQPATNVTGLLVEQTTAGSTTADIFDVDGVGGSADNFIQVTSTAANQGAVNISSLGSNAVTLNGGSDVALVSSTIYIGGPSTTYSTASTTDIGYTSSASGTQIVNIGSSAKAADAVTIASGSTGGITITGNTGITGNLSATGTYNTNTFTSTALTFSGASPIIGASTANTGLSVQANGTGQLTLNTSGAGTVNLGTTNSTTIGIGNTTAATTTLIQGGTGTSALSLQVGAAGTITIGAGSSGSTATTVNIATYSGAAQKISIGSNNSSGTYNVYAGALGEAITNTGDTINSSSATATEFVVQNTSSYGILSVDSSGNQVLLGTASHLTGKLAFASSTGGTLTINPTNSASNFTITLPAETGTVCTTASTGVCNTTGSLSNVAYLPQTQTFTGTDTFAPTTNISSLVVKQTSAASPTADVFDVQGTNGTSNFLQVTSTGANTGAVNINSFGSGAVTITGANDIALVSGTTYIGGNGTGYTTASTTYIGYTTSGASSQSVTIGSTTNVADSLTLNSGSTGGITVNGNTSITGNLTVSGTYNTNTFTSSLLTFAGSSPIISASPTNASLTLQANGTGTLLLNTTGAGTVDLGTSASTTIAIGNSVSATAVSIQGGTGSNALSLQVGANGTINIGPTGSTANNTTLNIATTTGGAEGLTIGSSNTGSTNKLVAGSTSINITNSGALLTSANNSTTALQVYNNSSLAVVTVNTSSDVLTINSGTSGLSGLQFSQLNSTSSVSSSFSQLLGLDSSGDVGLSSAGISLTSPALAYWDGLNDPTTGSQSYPTASLSGNAVFVGGGNGVELTTNTNNENGSINWNFSQVPFEEIQFQFKAGGGTGADSTWFYSYANTTPTTEYGAGGFTQGYLIYFSEYHSCAGIAWGGYTDGNQCSSGGGTSPLTSVSLANIANNTWHDVDIMILYNQIIVRWDNSVIMDYTDIYGRNTADLNFGFGSRTGGSNDYHYIKGLLVTKLGTNVSEYNIDSVDPLANNLTWNNNSYYLGINNSAPTANLDVSGTTLLQGTNSTSELVVDTSGSVPILTVDTSNDNVIIGSATANTNNTFLVLNNYSTAGSDPTGGMEGAMYYNTGDNSFRCYENTVWRSCIGGLANSSTAASSAIANTTTKTNFSGGTNNSYSVLSNDCQTGVTYLITATGTYSTTGTPTLTLYLDEDGTGTSLLTSPTLTTPSGASNYGWHLNAQMTCDSTTSVEIEGAFTFGNNNSTPTAASLFEVPNTGTLTWSTAAHTLYVGAQWGTRSSSNTITMRQFIIQRLGP